MTAPMRLAQPLDPKDWKRASASPIPGKTMPTVTVVERDYPHMSTSASRRSGPLMEKLGNGIKGMAWKTGA